MTTPPRIDCPRHGETRALKIGRMRNGSQRFKCARCVKDYRKKRRAAKPEEGLLQAAKQRAARAGLPFTLTEKDIILPDHCPVLGIPLRVSTTLGGEDGSPSLDRLVPEFGYVPGNVRVISHRANTIKGNATAEELERVAAWMRTQGLS